MLTEPTLELIRKRVIDTRTPKAYLQRDALTLLDEVDEYRQTIAEILEILKGNKDKNALP
jgi:hypothetical protein